MASLLVPANVFTAGVKITNPGAVTNIVLHAAATKPLVLIRARIELAQATVPADAHCAVKLVRKTVAGTYTSIAATTFVLADPVEPDPSCTAGHTASGEGTDGDAVEYGWGARTGWVFDWAPTDMEYVLVQAGTANGIGLKHVTAPPAGVYTFSLTAGEVG
jgi:hypothetical protein